MSGAGGPRSRRSLVLSAEILFLLVNPVKLLGQKDALSVALPNLNMEIVLR
jgi:hypothetical protein